MELKPLSHPISKFEHSWRCDAYIWGCIQNPIAIRWGHPAVTVS